MTIPEFVQQQAAILIEGERAGADVARTVALAVWWYSDRHKVDYLALCEAIMEAFEDWRGDTRD